MLSQHQIRLQLNDLHTCITDVLECIDEHAYTDAEATLDHMQSDIACLRKDVSEMFDARDAAAACQALDGRLGRCQLQSCGAL